MNVQCDSHCDQRPTSAPKCTTKPHPHPQSPASPGSPLPRPSPQGRLPNSNPSPPQRRIPRLRRWSPAPLERPEAARRPLHQAHAEIRRAPVLGTTQVRFPVRPIPSNSVQFNTTCPPAASKGVLYGTQKATGCDLPLQTATLTPPSLPHPPVPVAPHHSCGAFSPRVLEGRRSRAQE